MAGHCLNTAKLCAIRVRKLDGNCGCGCGDEAAVATSAIVRATTSQLTVGGTEYNHRSGMGGGDVTLLMREIPTLTGLSVSLELCTRDLELVSLLTGGELYRNGELLPIGVSHRSVKTAPPPVSVEIWTKNISATGACVSDQIPLYTRVVWPLARFVLQDSEYFNGITTVRLGGAVWANAEYPTIGCWDDLPEFVTLNADHPEHQFYDTELPTLACGFMFDPCNPPPIVDAGIDQTVDFPDDVSLVGSASDDGLPDPLTTLWTVVSGPGTVTFGDATALSTTASFSVAGEYVLRLTADDGMTDVSDDITVTSAPPFDAGCVDCPTIIWDTRTWNGNNGATYPAEIARLQNIGTAVTPSTFDNVGGTTTYDFDLRIVNGIPGNASMLAFASTFGSYFNNVAPWSLLGGTIQTYPWTFIAAVGVPHTSNWFFGFDFYGEAAYPSAYNLGFGIGANGTASGSFHVDAYGAVLESNYDLEVTYNGPGAVPTNEIFFCEMDFAGAVPYVKIWRGVSTLVLTATTTSFGTTVDDNWPNMHWNQIGLYTGGHAPTAGQPWRGVRGAAVIRERLTEERRQEWYDFFYL